MSLSTARLAENPNRFGLLHSVRKLLMLRLRIMWNEFRRAKLRSKIGRLFLALLIVGGMVFLYWISTLLLRFLQSPTLAEFIDPRQFLKSIPTLVLTLAFAVIIFTNFGVLLQALYLSHDMDFLVTKPIPMRAVFIAKLLEAILPNFGLFCAFSLPVLFGIGAASGYTWLFYPLLVLLLAVLALAAGGLASILVMAVVRVVPAKRVAEVLGFLGATISILCGQTGNIINMANIDQTDTAGMLALLTRFDQPWSPMAWAGRGIDAVGRGDWLPGLGLTLLSVAAAALVFGGTLLLAQNLYYSGWASMQGASGRKKKRKVAPATATAPTTATASADAAPAALPLAAAVVPSAAGSAKKRSAFGWLPRPMRGIILKDALLLRRDPRNLSQFITPVIVGAVMLFSTSSRSSEVSADLGLEQLEGLQVFILLALSMFVGWMLLFSLGTLAFSREGKNYWLTRVSPVRPLHLLGAKFIVAYLPTLAFGLAYILTGFVVNELAWGLFPFAALAVLMSLAGATGIAVAFGVAGANLTWDSPQRQRLRGSAGCLVFIAVAGFQFMDLLLFVLLPGLWLIFGQGTPPAWLYLVGGLIGSAVALLVVFFSLRLVVPKLATLGET